MTKVKSSQFTQQDGGVMRFIDAAGVSYSFSRHPGPFSFNVTELSVFEQFIAEWGGDGTELPRAERQVKGEAVVCGNSRSFSVIGIPGKTTTRVGLLIRGRNSEQHEIALQHRQQTEDKFRSLEAACFDAYLGFTLGEKEYGTNDSWWLEIWVAKETLNALADEVLADSLQELQIRVRLMDVFTEAGPGELDFGEDINLCIRPDTDADGDKPQEYGWGYGSLVYWYARSKGEVVFSDPNYDVLLAKEIDQILKARYEWMQTETDSSVRFIKEHWNDRVLWTTKALSKAVALSVARNKKHGISRNDGIADALRLIDELQDHLQKVNWLFMDGKLNESQREFYNTINRNEIFWWNLNAETMAAIPTAKRTFNPYYTNTISDGCFAYLARPWMECPRLELALVNALAYLRLLEVGISINDARRGWISRAVFRTLVGLSLGLGCAASYGFAVGAVAGLAVWSGLTLVKTFSENWKIESQRKQLFMKMLSISHLLNDERTSPKLVRELVYDTQKAGAAWPAGMIVLIDSAARRDSISWCNTGS